MSGARLGLDIGGSKIQAAVVARDGTVRTSRRTPTRREEGADAVIARAFGLGREMVAASDAAGEAVGGIGIGFAGLVDHITGIVDSSVIIPGFDGWPLRERAEAAFRLPCAIDNDATAAGLGELRALGSPPGLNMVLLTVGTGIGGAIVLGGELYRGSTNTSAEFGNTTIDWRGRACASNNRGSLNTLASGEALRRRAAELAREDRSSVLAAAIVTGEAITGEMIAAAAETGDPAACAAIDEAARALGAAIANVINVFNPDRVALTGGVCALGPGYLETVRAEACARAFRRNAEHAVIELTHHGALTCAHGAACLAWELSP